jgi:hypothetical protein
MSRNPAATAVVAPFAHPQASAVLGGLVKDAVISPAQAARLDSRWDDLPAAWASDPELFDLRECTRFLIERERQLAEEQSV